MHVVLRTLPGVPRLRQQAIFKAVRHALDLVLSRGGVFRIVHASIQHNHLHLIVEASMREVLIKGMQAFAISAARSINGACGRRGRVFAHRYHATAITSPKQMRHTIAYVLNNWRRHGEDRRSARAMAERADPYSTARWFTGWAGMEDQVLAAEPGYAALPAANPTCWLLTTGWKLHGLIGFRERPGPLHAMRSH